MNGLKEVNDDTIILEGINRSATYDDYILGALRRFDEYGDRGYGSRKLEIIHYLMDVGTYFRKSFPQLIKDLDDLEDFLYATNKFYRDHVVHTFRVWGLGLFIYHNGLREFAKKHEHNKFHFQWYISSVYHDIGYSITVLEKISKRLNGHFGYLDINELVDFDDKIAPKLEQESLQKELVSLFPNYSDELDGAVLNQRHGLLGARTLLLRMRTVFSSIRDEAVSAVIAIGEHDGNNELSLKDDLFPALLVICDELQEWGRPFISSKLGRDFITTNQIKLDCDFKMNMPLIKAEIDYSENEKRLQDYLGWDGAITRKNMEKNLGRITDVRFDITLKTREGDLKVEVN
jgi:hypothetical protein